MGKSHNFRDRFSKTVDAVRITNHLLFLICMLLHLLSLKTQKMIVKFPYEKLPRD